MTTIGFLACETTLPLPWGGIGERRGDAFEHDLMINALKPAFHAEGLELRVIDWEAPLEDFAGIDVALLGTSWNYQDKAGEFLTKLEAIAAAGVTVCNPPDIVRWNIEKTYLRDLAKRGAATIPTLWLDTVNAADAREAMEQFNCDRIVVKRQVGAGAIGQELLKRSEIPEDWCFAQPAMVQPFLPAIAEEGELSFLFIGGEFSHALRKRAAKGDYRIQSLYGGYESVHTPSPADLASARAIMQALPFPAPLYARIDMLSGDNGLLLMEAELIEPYFYPEQGPQLGERLAHAIQEKIAAA